VESLPLQPALCPRQESLRALRQWHLLRRHHRHRPLPTRCLSCRGDRNSSDSLVPIRPWKEHFQEREQSPSQIPCSWDGSNRTSLVPATLAWCQDYPRTHNNGHYPRTDRVGLPHRCTDIRRLRCTHSCRSLFPPRLAVAPRSRPSGEQLASAHVPCERRLLHWLQALADCCSSQGYPLPAPRLRVALGNCLADSGYLGRCPD